MPLPVHGLGFYNTLTYSMSAGSQEKSTFRMLSWNSRLHLIFCSKHNGNKKWRKSKKTELSASASEQAALIRADSEAPWFGLIIILMALSVCHYSVGPKDIMNVVRIGSCHGSFLSMPNWATPQLLQQRLSACQIWDKFGFVQMWVWIKTMKKVNEKRKWKWIVSGLLWPQIKG